MAVNGQDAAATKGGGRTTPDKLNRVDFNWHIVRTLPHQESKLAAMLGERLPEMENVLEVYCPTHTTVSVSRGGRREQVPLFAGYVFVLATHEALAAFMASRYPAGTILYDRRREPGRRARLLTIPEEQMRFFMDFNENYAERVLVLERPYSDYAFNPKTGEPNEIVRVADGPLAGREGLTLADLEGQEFLLTERGMSYREALEQLLAAEEDRAAGRIGCTLEELERFLEEALDRV